MKDKEIKEEEEPFFKLDPRFSWFSPSTYSTIENLKQRMNM